VAAVSRAKRASNNKWDAQNMKVAGAKIKKEEYDLFKKYCEARNQTVSSMLTGYIRRCILGDQQVSD